MQNKLDYNIDWSTSFELNEKSPSGLIKVKNGYGKPIIPYSVGTKIFQKSGDPGAWMIYFNKSRYVAHRTIWVMVYGSIDPSLVIDHLDGNPFNNSIGNLSLKTTADNARNARKYRSNTTGTTGVSITKVGGRYYYRVEWIEISGKIVKRAFSIDDLGDGTAKSLAIACRTQQIERLVSEGADYTERHGKQ